MKLVSQKYSIALLAASGVFIAMIVFYSNAGTATNDPFRFKVWEAIESLSFLVSWITGLPSILALIFGSVFMLLPSYFTYILILKMLNKNESTN